MRFNSPTTRYVTLSRRRALLILCVTAAGMLWCLSASFCPKPAEELPAADGSDLRLYRRIVERVHAGENYYDAAGQEIRAAGYPTGSLFNWRPPVYAWLFGIFPDPSWAQAVLGAIAIVTLLMACVLMHREGGLARAAAGLFPLVGAFHWCIDGDAFFSQELWAGLLIAFSVCAYAQDRWRLGLAAGLFALFLRELTLPYCLISLVLAWRRQHRAEVILWFVGFGLYGLFMWLHGLAVAGRLGPAERVPASWVQFGGATFLLTTCRMNAYLFSAPSWLSAIYLPVALLGVAGWRGWTGARLALTAGAYVTAFTVVGQPFNDYWGLLPAPLLAFGFAAAPEALRDLLACVSRSQLICERETQAAVSGGIDPAPQIQDGNQQQ